VETAKLNNKRKYDREVYVPKFEVESMVLMRDESVRRGRSKNLEAAYIGPCEILRIEDRNLVLRTRQCKDLKKHANRAKLFCA
jgi:hypothetical protein